MLETHLNHTESVNIFDILIDNILPHAENRFTSNEIGEDWQLIETDLALEKETGELLTYMRTQRILAKDLSCF